jgi:hypothetical protein
MKRAEGKGQRAEVKGKGKREEGRSKRLLTFVLLTLTFALCPLPSALFGAPADVQGRVEFSALPVPGASVTATKGPRTVSALSGDDGVFQFAGLEDGTWTIRVEMRGFVAIKRDIVVPVSEAAAASLTFTLVMKPFAEVAVPEMSDIAPSQIAPTLAAIAPEAPEVMTGSTINGAASRFAQTRAMGNNRPNMRSPYSGGIAALVGNSALNAKPFSFGGSSASLPNYSDVQVSFSLLGPLKIPFVVKYGPQMSLSYQRGVLHNATTQSAIMPTLAERGGDLSLSSSLFGAPRDPLTGQLFPGGVIPGNRITPQAAALLAYYPLPNGETTTGANYQVPVTSATTQDNVQFGTSKAFTPRVQGSVRLGYQRAITDSVTLFDFADQSRSSGFNVDLGLSRRWGQRFQMRLSYRFDRTSSTTTPFFANRGNVSGDAGIIGNNQDPLNWGPPSLQFPAIADLSAAQYQRSIRSTHAIGLEAIYRRGRHNWTMGGDVRRLRNDVSSQPDPRGTLAFTGSATGNAFADFLLGLPATSSIGFGESAAELRGRTYDLYVTDDFRIGAGLTLNAGVRWEYETPYTEKSGHLANLAAEPGFSSVTTVVGSPVRPDRTGIEPRIGLAWRPVLGSSLVLRASYGLYRNLGVYQPLGLLLAQQPPFTKTFSVQTSAAAPLTLANPFPPSIPSANTFGIDPGFKPGSVHSWTASVQRDFPASLTVIAAYFGDKGVNLMQAFLPNTYPAGSTNPCASCPAGFVFVTSSGSSIRNAGQFTLRRRLYAGFTATAQYTLAKAMDDAATFSNAVVRPQSLAIAQDWLNLDAERAPSSFDQRHLVTFELQYTTGVGVAGGTLVDGLWGTLYKDWTFTSQMRTGSGLPLTPVAFSVVSGSGVVGVRPSLTGVPVSPTESGFYANPLAFTPPAPGTWGNAGRNSIRGPKQFSLDATLARVFRLRGRLNLEFRIAATNVLNRVTYSSINTIISSPQFGQAIAANQMRRIQMRFGFKF